MLLGIQPRHDGGTVSELHREEPHREYCFFHTSRPELVARERYVGIRGPR